MYAEQLLPHDIAAEEAVIGSLLIDSDSFLHVSHLITPDDFYREPKPPLFLPLAPTCSNAARPLTR